MSIKSGLYGGLAFIQSIRAISKVFKKQCLAEKKKTALQKHFSFWACILGYKFVGYYAKQGIYENTIGICR